MEVEQIHSSEETLRSDKRGHIEENNFSFLKQLVFSGEDWLELAEHLGKKYHRAVDSLAKLSRLAVYMEKRGWWLTIAGCYFSLSLNY